MKTLNTTTFVVVITAFVYFFLSFFLAAQYDFNLTAFISIGNKQGHYTNAYLSEEYLSDDMVVFKDIPGYDGGQYFFMAHDPLLLKKGYMDSFRTRHMFRYKKRILYPLLVYLFSLGNPVFIPLLMLLVNGIAITIGTYCFCKLLTLYGATPWLALVFSLSSGILFSFFYPLTEPLGYALVIVSLYFYKREKKLLCILFLTFSLFAREPAILVIWTLMGYELMKKRYAMCALIAVSVIPVLLYQYGIGYRAIELGLVAQKSFLFDDLFHELYTSIFSGSVGIPFKGMVNAILHTSFATGGIGVMVRSFSKLFIMILLVSCCILSIKNLYAEENLYSLMILIHLLFMLRGYEDLWSTFLNGVRTNAYIFLLLPLSYAENRDRYFPSLITLSCVMSLLAVVKLWADTSREYYLFGIGL